MDLVGRKQRTARRYDYKFLRKKDFLKAKQNPTVAYAIKIQNSVRHNLSLNKAFCKLERPDGTSQRKGCLWSLKPEKKEQLEREIRKWKKKHPEAIKASMANPDELSLSSDSLDDDSLEDRKTPSPEHTVPESGPLESNTVHIEEVECEEKIKDEPIDELAVENAAKELFGSDLLFQDDLQPEEFWNEFITSSENTALLDQLHGQYASSITDGELDDSSSEYTIKVEPRSPVFSSYSHSPLDPSQELSF